MLNNKELRRGFAILLLTTVVLTFAGFQASFPCGCLVFSAGIVTSCIYLLTEFTRYKALQKMIRDLDDLLTSGKPLHIWEYDEGELSVLANQIQKMALRLQEAAETSRMDKAYLADSLADISHQLRTPLTVMNLTATMLRSQDLTAEKRIDLTKELRTLLERTEWLVETLLKLSKLDAGTVKLSRDEISVRALIERSVAPIAIPMDLRNQSLRIRCAEERMTGDLAWCAEALGNILKNCMEHTPAGGTIFVEVEDTALYTQIQIRDTGAGFDPKDLPHLFERFYKGANASQSSYGIGLALARTVITAHNGTIQAMNGNPGALFIIKFYKQVI